MRDNMDTISYQFTNENKEVNMRIFVQRLLQNIDTEDMDLFVNFLNEEINKKRTSDERV